VLPLPAAITEPVRVEQGLLAGVAGAAPEVRVFKGVPFAAAPVSDLRWRGPKPAPQWTGVRNASEFSAICMQRRPNAAGIGPEPRPMGEDCLYLNIYTAAKTANDKLPVMVWIHGGALTAGAGSIYDGEQLARKGVLVVTINYRLGVFGFFAHPELSKESDRGASSNYGLLDQIAALQWVQKNIAAFGGDTRRVTIFGESAGSWSTNLLAASPLARGLFHRVIGESGGQFEPMRSLAQAEQAGPKFGTLAELRAKTADELQSAMGATFVGVNGGYSVVDGWCLPEEVYNIYANGKQADVPVLIGSNADEGTRFTPATVTLQTMRDSAQQRFGPVADAFLKLYPAHSDTEAWRAQADSMRDQVSGWELRTWARMQTKTGKSKVYLYFFSHVPPGPTAARMGAHHSAEIAYVFHNTHRPTRPWEETDHQLSEIMSSYWLNFAATGDPNGKGLPAWPAFDSKADLAMGLREQVEVVPLPHQFALDFWEGYFENRRKSPRQSAQ
jgi:para-nitrobenzyl esterase